MLEELNNRKDGLEEIILFIVYENFLCVMYCVSVLLVVIILIFLVNLYW